MLRKLIVANALGVFFVGSWVARLSAQEFVPDRLIVKFDPVISADIQVTLSQGRSFRAQAPNTALDSLMRRHGVRGARRLLARGAGNYAEARAFLESQASNSRQKLRGDRNSARLLPDLGNIYVLELASGQDVLQAAAEFAKDAYVIYAAPDHVFRLDVGPNDPCFEGCRLGDGAGFTRRDQYGPQITRTPRVWNLTQGEGVIAAVIDGGINRFHEDIDDNIWWNPGEVDDGLDNDGNGFVDDMWGWDFAACDTYDWTADPPVCTDPDSPEEDNAPLDEDGHGTHVAGILAAETDNGLDIAGLAFQTKVIALKVCQHGGCVGSAIVEAIVYAAHKGAQIINMSFGSSERWEGLEDAVQYAHGLGVLLIAAAGNSRDDTPWYPAALEQVVAVGGTDRFDALYGSSSFGEHLELAAPGSRVLSLRANDPHSGEPGRSGVDLKTGTSMAAPHVAGLAALLWAWKPSLSVEEVRDSLCAGAIDLGDPGRDPFFGCGRIDAMRTLQTVCAVGICGDGVYEPACGEECDDGNSIEGDCCSSTCQLVEPQEGCRKSVAPFKVRLILTDKDDDSKDKLTWRWIRGAKTDTRDFGDPVATHDYRVCIYEDTDSSASLVVGASAPAGSDCAGKPCWRAAGTRGFKYKDRAQRPDGLDMISLGSGDDGKAKVIIKGKGANLRMPLLPLTLPVTVQLQAANGECWEAEYSSAGVRWNQADLFTATAGSRGAVLD